jgi:hypothetical protein
VNRTNKNTLGSSSKGVLADITVKGLLKFYDAFDRANRQALGRVVVTFALHAQRGIDHVVVVAFADGGGGAVRLASAAGNAIISDFHSHGIKSPSFIYGGDIGRKFFLSTADGIRVSHSNGSVMRQM